jgi:hypothetical protein
MTADTIKLRAWLSDVVTAALKVPHVEDAALQAWAYAISVNLDNAALAAIRELGETFERRKPG